jgi:hypothetical protein
MQNRPFHRQHGAASLIVTLVIFFVMTLIAAFANRNHIFEQRASANQYRAAQAFEAAEAGVDWAIAMLNTPEPVDTACRPDAAGGSTFRGRHLSVDAGGMQVPTTWNHAGMPAPLQAVCVRSGTGWSCSCPASGAPALSKPSGPAAAPAFAVRFAAAPHPGVVTLAATGCSSLDGECAPGTAADAVSHLQVTLGLVGGLATWPVAPLTSRGAVQAGAAALGLHNPDASAGGITLHAGGNLLAPQARIDSAPGASAAASIIEGDAQLQAMSTDRLFAAFFGIDKTWWRQQPGVARIDCQGDCTALLPQTIGASATPRMVWIDGNLPLRGPVTIGTPLNPVIVVASGTAQFDGAVVFHGLLYAAAIEWNNAAPGSAVLRGAAISEAGYQGNGAPDFFYDTAILAALKNSSGSFARVPGSWKDF